MWSIEGRLYLAVPLATVLVTPGSKRFAEHLSKKTPFDSIVEPHRLAVAGVPDSRFKTHAQRTCSEMWRFSVFRMLFASQRV